MVACFKLLVENMVELVYPSADLKVFHCIAIAKNTGYKYTKSLPPKGITAKDTIHIASTIKENTSMFSLVYLGIQIEKKKPETYTNIATNLTKKDFKSPPKILCTNSIMLAV